MWAIPRSRPGAGTPLWTNPTNTRHTRRTRAAPAPARWLVREAVPAPMGAKRTPRAGWELPLWRRKHELSRPVVHQRGCLSVAPQQRQREYSASRIDANTGSTLLSVQGLQFSSRVGPRVMVGYAWSHTTAFEAQLLGFDRFTHSIHGVGERESDVAGLPGPDRVPTSSMPTG